MSDTIDCREPDKQTIECLADVDKFVFDCDICKETYNIHNIVKLGCCSFKGCRDCVIKCKKCPQCRGGLYYSTNETNINYEEIYRRVYNRHAESLRIIERITREKGKLESELMKIKKQYERSLVNNKQLIDEINQYRQYQLDEKEYDKRMEQTKDVILRYNLNLI